MSRACLAGYDCRLSALREVPQTAPGDAAAASPGSVTAFLNELTIAALGHPAGAGEMGVVDETGALRLPVRVDAEEDRHGLTPIRTVGIRVEQAQIEFHMRAIVACERWALRWMVQERFLCHADPPQLIITASASIVNHIGFGVQ